MINYFELIKYIIIGFLINVFLSFVFFISVYMNGKTYHGVEGHNNGIVVLFFAAPIWTYIMTRKLVYKKREAIIGLTLNALFSFVMLLIITISEIYD